MLKKLEQTKISRKIIMWNFAGVWLYNFFELLCAKCCYATEWMVALFCI